MKTWAERSLEGAETVVRPLVTSVDDPAAAVVAPSDDKLWLFVTGGWFSVDRASRSSSVKSSLSCVVSF